MGYISDPTASRAIGEIDREFSRLKKKAKRLRERLEAGTLSQTELRAAQSQFKGIYRHVLTNELNENRDATGDGGASA